MGKPYIGRFAPSPTGPLHAGSLVAALASWLDARAHQGTWLVRIEDVDTPRTVQGAASFILQQLAQCGLIPDQPPTWQSKHTRYFQAALDQLTRQGQAYACVCSRSAIEAASVNHGLNRPRNTQRIYPGTCRPPTCSPGLVQTESTTKSTQALQIKPAAWRFRTDHLDSIDWCDRRKGPQTQVLAPSVGDFVLQRADLCWAYQLAVVVDDARQNISHVVRGEDLVDNTARQIALQTALGLNTPRYLHTPLVKGANGEKLSKQNGALPVDTTTPLIALNTAAQSLGLSTLPASHSSLPESLQSWVLQWASQGFG